MKGAEAHRLAPETGHMGEIHDMIAHRSAFVKDYFEKARKFLNEEDEDISFIEKEKVIKGQDDFLKDGYDRFKSFINTKNDFFSKLFIFK